MTTAQAPTPEDSAAIEALWFRADKTVAKMRPDLMKIDVSLVPGKKGYLRYVYVYWFVERAWRVTVELPSGTDVRSAAALALEEHFQNVIATIAT